MEKGWPHQTRGKGRAPRKNFRLNLIAFFDAHSWAHLLSSECLFSYRFLGMVEAKSL